MSFGAPCCIAIWLPSQVVLTVDKMTGVRCYLQAILTQNPRCASCQNSADEENPTMFYCHDMTATLGCYVSRTEGGRACRTRKQQVRDRSLRPLWVLPQRHLANRMTICFRVCQNFLERQNLLFDINSVLSVRIGQQKINNNNSSHFFQRMCQRQGKIWLA